jgi:hypothetical protein
LPDALAEILDKEKYLYFKGLKAMKMKILWRRRPVPQALWM